ncbi:MULTISPECIES: DUF397 domain-containing protein [Actinomadura]|jgi:hypothetical protein|uniref:DUF397 domain-containing protein n=1 Tax=Actinomadura geliboluensis TaxID=882440 RepID=A0A5S4HAL9_9ACTN|nr:DUF397 domain-containing protein [Actinomadura geliboluensis]TMR35920.1 DUF397 domain-containing protein [Actinomadura geliboluensis]
MDATDPSQTRWRKSTRSGQNGACVEITHIAGAVAVRDSKAPDAGHITLSHRAWATFIKGARAGRYDH